MLSQGSEGTGFQGQPGQPNPGRATAQVQFEAPAMAPPEVVIRRGATLVSGRLTTVIVGQRIALAGDVQYLPQGVTVTRHTWSVTGNPVAGYTQTVSAATVAGYAPPGNSASAGDRATAFHWTRGGEFEATYTALLSDGRTVTGTARFTVLRPAASLTGVRTALQPPMDVRAVLTDLSRQALQFGYEDELVNNGITLNATVATPVGGAGQVGIVQLIRVRRSYFLQDDSQTLLSSAGAAVLDGGEGIRYGNEVSLPQLTEVVLSRNDSPSMGVTSQHRSATMSDSFEDFLMYRPAGEDSIWVTLRLLRWAYDGTATSSGGAWQVSPGQSSSVIPPGEDSVTLPTWNAAASSLTFSPF